VLSVKHLIPYPDFERSVSEVLDRSGQKKKAEKRSSAFFYYLDMKKSAAQCGAIASITSS
jgi:hypothetical protein